MIRLGLKFTHDGGLAVFDGTRLVFSHEAEKSDNQRRHVPLGAIDVVRTLAGYGVGLADVDRVVVDGWMNGVADADAGHGSTALAVSHYHEHPEHPDGLRHTAHHGLRVGGRTLPYVSYPHSTGHVVGTYATSPWATARAQALVLVWDGGMLPRLYHLDPVAHRLRLLRPLLGFVGNVYPVFASYLRPFTPSGDGVPPDHDELPEDALLSLPGRVMAWAGLGQARPELMDLFDDVYRALFDLRWDFLFDFTRTVHRRRPPHTTDEDLAASFQAWLGGRLVDGLKRALARERNLPPRLCFTGGCALNVGWNAGLRASGLFEDVWVPPFPNDAGSALGAAAADLLHEDGATSIEWDVYRGPPLLPSEGTRAYARRMCTIRQLARFLHRSQEPVVFLAGRAEIGPRALGNRSIFCSARDPQAKAILNRVKDREDYRPVAPICLESEAPRIFDPGTPDPYMLFTHRVRAVWRERVPAIVHVDGTARLQTVNATQNPLVAELLREHHACSGIPLLCNTSANLKGRGFFPDLRSAMAWPGAAHVWCDGVLYSRTG